MRIQEVFKEKSILANCVPIAIEPLGIIYMNDIKTWVLTINSTHHECITNTITAKQLEVLFEQQSTYFPTVKETYEKELPIMLSYIRELEENEILTF